MHAPLDKENRRLKAYSGSSIGACLLMLFMVCIGCSSSRTVAFNEEVVAFNEEVVLRVYSSTEEEITFSARLDNKVCGETIYVVEEEKTPYETSFTGSFGLIFSKLSGRGDMVVEVIHRRGAQERRMTGSWARTYVKREGKRLRIERAEEGIGR